MNNERIEIPIEESEEFEIERYLFISNDTITPIVINDSVSRVDGNI